MVAHFTRWTNVNQRELSHSNDGEHKYKQHEKQTKRCHTRRGIEQRLEDFLKLLLLFDQAEDTTDTKST